MALSLRKIARWVLISLLVGFVGIQIVRPDRTNPPTDAGSTLEARFHPDPEVSRLLAEACNDCHSHQTTWPWYSNVAPVSWLVADDVHEGRKHFNLSRIGEQAAARQSKSLSEAAEEVGEGGMPPQSYTLTHPGARLSADDRRRLAAWFESAAASVGGDSERSGSSRSKRSGRGRDEDEDRGR